MLTWLKGYRRELLAGDLGAGVLVVLFTIEHVIALLQGKEVVPAWN